MQKKQTFWEVLKCLDHCTVVESIHGPPILCAKTCINRKLQNEIDRPEETPQRECRAMVLLLFRQASCRAEVAGNRWDPFGNAPEPRRKHRLNHLERRQARARNPLALRNVVVCVLHRMFLWVELYTLYRPPSLIPWIARRGDLGERSD